MPFLVISVEGALRAATRATRSRGDAGRLPLDRVPPGHPAADRARRGGRRGTSVGPRARRVRPTITFAANFPGKTQTMPLAVYCLETDPEAAIVLSLVLLAVSVLILAGLRER